MNFALTEKNNPLAIHGIFGSQARAEWFLENVVPKYCARGFYDNKTLKPDDFTVRPWSSEDYK
jgi:hypothetical protein